MRKINKNMKNKTLIFAAIVAFFVLAATASAMTTVSLSPVSVSVEEGQTFNLAVSVNSQIVKSYMVKLEIKFPADILEVESSDVLFDSNLNLFPSGEINPGSKINAEIKIFDLSQIGVSSVELSYFIKDFQGNT